MPGDVRAEVMAARLHAAAVRLLRLARQGRADAPNAPHLSALGSIAAAGPLALRDLAAREGVRAPTMSRSVERLVAAGLASREPDPDDRRRVRIAVTEAGRSLLAADRGQPGAIAGRLSRLAESERRALERGVELIERLVRT
ncbi:MAG TPA: MarR family transcriptional regulator [Allosphingosinicella sp.]|nr:MarR family transcriptional regulator [Allosphingosinicella sp.]